MTIPIATTTVSVVRTTGTGDAYDEPTRETLATGVRAVIGRPYGRREPYQEGTYSERRLKLTCDPLDLRAGDLVTDAHTGREYTVAWALTRPDPLSHTEASIEDMAYG